MNFVGFILTSLITFILTTFAFTQIVGILFVKFPKKQFNGIIGLIIWGLVLYALYSIIFYNFTDYMELCVIISIVTFSISITSIKKMKLEDTMKP